MRLLQLSKQKKKKKKKKDWQRVRIEKQGQKCCHRDPLHGKVNNGWLGRGEGKRKDLNNLENQAEVGMISKQMIQGREQTQEERMAG